MGKKTFKVLECTCERCGHTWITRKDTLPLVCPRCKSPYWDTPIKNKKSD